MTWNNIEINVPLTECYDSLLFDAGDIIATLESSNGVCASIVVRGEIRIAYQDEIYRYPSNYPDKLTQAIKDRTIGQLERDGIVEVLNNNWYEIIVEKNDEHICDDVWEMVLNVVTDDKLRDEIIDYVETSCPDILSE